MTAPLYDTLKKLSPIQHPFYMPGHKRKPYPHLQDLLSLDFTEIQDTDNLHFPSSHILHAQSLMAELYGADESFFLVNGTSCGIMAAVLSVCSKDDKILVARNSHISVYNALTLSGAFPIYIYPEITHTGLVGGISPLSVEKALSENPEIKACVVTSPTYEGFVSDISEISDILHKKNKILIVDEAHGAAFSLSPSMPSSAINCGADIVVQSWHKTLPALTQSAVAHIKGSLADRELFKYYLRIFQSTSPSFIFMAVLDKCREYIQENGTWLFSELFNNIADFRRNTSDFKKISLVSPSIVNSFGIKTMDLTRLTFIINSDITGSALDNLLNKRYNIRFEMAGIHHLTAITTIADSKEDLFLLSSALEYMEDRIRYKEQKAVTLKTGQTKTMLVPYKLTGQKTKICPFDSSAGSISAEYIIPYPPGIPLLIPGELITEEILNLAKLYKSSSVPLNGIKDDTLTSIHIIA